MKRMTDFRQREHALVSGRGKEDVARKWNGVSVDALWFRMGEIESPSGRFQDLSERRS